MYKSELKPCPFCGEGDYYNSVDRGLEIRGDAVDHRTGIFDSVYWVVDCHTCGASSPIAMSERICLIKWNRREVENG